ncbi:hypothetical protein KCU73_g12909, partial [Aureobasidium melanogenum]
MRDASVLPALKQNTTPANTTYQELTNHSTNPILIQIYQLPQSKMTANKKDTMNMSSLSNSINEIAVAPAKPRPKGKITRNIPFEQELVAKANGTYVNSYSAADDKKMNKYLDKQGYKGPRH